MAFRVVLSCGVHDQPDRVFGPFDGSLEISAKLDGLCILVDGRVIAFAYRQSFWWFAAEGEGGSNGPFLKANVVEIANEESSGVSAVKFREFL